MEVCAYLLLLGLECPLRLIGFTVRASLTVMDMRRPFPELYLHRHMWDSLEGKLNCDQRIRHCFVPGNPNQAFNLLENLLGGKNLP